jgi:hypothetical protein
VGAHIRAEEVTKVTGLADGFCNLVKVGGANGDQISRPERRQHALAHGREPQVAALPQNFGCQAMFLLIPGLRAILHAGRLGTPASTPALELGRDFAAGQGHGFEDLIGTEFGFLIKASWWIAGYPERTSLLQQKDGSSES